MSYNLMHTHLFSAIYKVPHEGWVTSIHDWGKNNVATRPAPNGLRYAKVTCNTCLKLCATLGDGQGALAILKDGVTVGEGLAVRCFRVSVGGRNCFPVFSFQMRSMFEGMIINGLRQAG